MGSPQRGTLAALPIPRFLLAGAADMKHGSDLLRTLNSDARALEAVSCRSYFCRWDLMVCPGWQAVLPVGPRVELPVWTHQQLIAHPSAVNRLAADLRLP